MFEIGISVNGAVVKWKFPLLPSGGSQSTKKTSSSVRDCIFYFLKVNGKDWNNLSPNWRSFRCSRSRRREGETKDIHVGSPNSTQFIITCKVTTQTRQKLTLIITNTSMDRSKRSLTVLDYLHRSRMAS